MRLFAFLDFIFLASLPAMPAMSACQPAMSACQPAMSACQPAVPKFFALLHLFLSFHQNKPTNKKGKKRARPDDQNQTMVSPFYKSMMHKTHMKKEREGNKTITMVSSLSLPPHSHPEPTHKTDRHNAPACFLHPIHQPPEPERRRRAR